MRANKLFPRLAPVFSALAIALCATAAVGEDEYGVLVNDVGVEETFAYCSACHSEMIVAQQGLTREGWDELLVWMVDEQGMSEIDEEERGLILDYLEKNYGPDRPNFPKR